MFSLPFLITLIFPWALQRLLLQHRFLKLSCRRVIFAAGSFRAETSAQATARISRAAATLPENVRQILTRPRKVGDPDAAVDPMNDPAVRDAVASATFQHVVGFQLTVDQLKYNATR
jgi:hypothetical protein